MTSTKTTTKTNHDFGTLVALAIMAAILALSALSAPASGQQSGDPNQGVSGAKMDAAIQSTTATTPKASFASGSGQNFLGVKVSDHGNLMSFESPQGQEQVFSGQEGYALCSDSGQAVHGHDTGSVESGFGAPTFSQPTAGKFPLSVTRKTTDGKFQLTQVWNKPDATEKDITVTMTLKNLSSTTIFGVFLSRSGDFDIGTSGLDQGARTGDSAWQWNDLSSNADTPPAGVILTALTFGSTARGAHIESRSDWANGAREECFSPNSLTTPTAVQDLAMRALYGLSSFNASQSKTVKFEYGRM